MKLQGTYGYFYTTSGHVQWMNNNIPVHAYGRLTQTALLMVDVTPHTFNLISANKNLIHFILFCFCCIEQFH